MENSVTYERREEMRSRYATPALLTARGLAYHARFAFFRFSSNIAPHVALLVRFTFLFLPSFILIWPFCFSSIHRIFDGVLHPKRESISKQQGGEFGFHATNYLHEGESRWKSENCRYDRTISIFYFASRTKHTNMALTNLHAQWFE